MEGIGLAHLLGAEAVELLVFGKEIAVGETGIEAPYRIEFIVGNHQVVARVSNSCDMARSNIASRTYKCEILHKLIVE